MVSSTLLSNSFRNFAAILHNDDMKQAISIYTLTSELHDEKAVGAATQAFLTSLGIEYELKGSDYGDYGSHALNLIYVRTGGTEGIFRRLLPVLQAKSGRPFYLLTSGKSNSLAASMEILSYLRQHNISGEIIHGSSDYIAHRIRILEKAEKARRMLCGNRLGIIGKPSDWLISSDADKAKVKGMLDMELVDIPMQELLDEITDSESMLTPVVVSNGPSVLGSYAALIALGYSCFCLHAICVYGSLVYLLGRMSPLKFFKTMQPAMLFAFSSDSSVATLPYTMACAVVMQRLFKTRS